MKMFSRYISSITLTIILTCNVSFGDQTKENLFKLMSLNVWQFAYGIESKNNSKRASRLAKTIQENHEKFDVIAFQEMWSNSTRNNVYEKIENLYPYRFEDNQWGTLLGLGYTSGLAIYSKYPILRRMQHTYNFYRGHEDLANKGIMGVEMSVLGRIVYVFTTHLQAGAGDQFFRFIDRNKPTTTEIAALQLLEAKEKINEFIIDKNAPVFFLGDFNITAGSQEYINDIGILGHVTDTFDPSQSKHISSDLNNPDSTNRIDYIFTLGYPMTGYSVVTDLFGGPKEVSDHRAVMGAFDISR